MRILSTELSITKYDLIVFVYNAAVVLSGGYAVMTMEVTDRPTLFAFAFVFGIVWTVYFKFAMFDRFADHPRYTTAGNEEDSAALRDRPEKASE